jgi:dolichol-phosphate mannosyltransferase
MKYSVVVPIYFDSYLAQSFCVEFKTVFIKNHEKTLIEGEVELIFVNDGSSKNDEEELERIAASFSFVKVIHLSRNFGQHIALSAGYKEATGDYIGMLNADMQEHPSEITKFLHRLERGGVDIVYGLRDSRKGKIGERLTSALFNRILNLLTGQSTPINVAPIRFMSRKFIDAYNSLNEKSRYLPGLESWLGFEKDYVDVSHQKRTKGKSSYNFVSRSKMAISTILSFSAIPLKFISLVGILVAIIGAIMAGYLVVSKLFFVDYQAGFTSTIVLGTLLSGLQISVIGLSALYIGRILTEVQNRPLYIIKEKINF